MRGSLHVDLVAIDLGLLEMHRSKVCNLGGYSNIHMSRVFQLCGCTSCADRISTERQKPTIHVSISPALERKTMFYRLQIEDTIRCLILQNISTCWCKRNKNILPASASCLPIVFLIGSIGPQINRLKNSRNSQEISVCSSKI